MRLPYNYLGRNQWHSVFQRLGLVPKQLSENLGIYPMPFDLVFGRGLHFVALISRKAA